MESILYIECFSGVVKVFHGGIHDGSLHEIGTLRKPKGGFQPVSQASEMDPFLIVKH
jgi:hypothetical protein